MKSSQYEELPPGDDLDDDSDDLAQKSTPTTNYHVLSFPEDKIDYHGDFFEATGKFGDQAILSKDNGQLLIIG